MAKWNVSASVNLWFTMVVEAETKEEAEDVAAASWTGLKDYPGNGRQFGTLVGHNNPNLTLEAPGRDAEIDIADVRPA